jgi:hypothetical protein
MVSPGGQPELVGKVQVPEHAVQELGAILEQECIVVAAFQVDGQARRLDPFGISNSTVGRVVLFEQVRIAIWTKKGCNRSLRQAKLGRGGRMT